MMKLNLLLILPFIAINILAQGVNGSVTNEEQSPIPFATISIKNTNKGCFTDEAGQFILPQTLNSKDTIAISCIGYQTAIVPAHTIQLPLSVTLKRLNHAIHAVTIKGHQRKLIKVKDKKRVSISACLSKGGELVTFIDIRKGSTLNDVTFYCQRTSSPKLLGVRVYNTNYKGEPGECIITENRVIEIGAFRNQLTFNLKDLNIVAQQNGLFVGIQYIYVNNLNTPKSKKQNPFIYFSTLNTENKTYIRSMAQDTFIKQAFGQKAFVSDKPINLQCSYSYFAP